MAGVPGFFARLNHATVFVSLSGQVSETLDFDDFTAFAEWKIIVEGHGDDVETVYEANIAMDRV